MNHVPQNTAVVLLPTYNERENIESIVPAILAAAPVDVCILDDASPDGTGALADALAAANPRVWVVHRPGKSGLGPAYLDGFKRALDAGYEKILHMDADFSHPPRYLPELMKLADTYDVVLGSRWVKGGGTENWPLRRQLISRCGSLYARTFLSVPVRDLTGGFKCFRRKVLATIDLDSIKTTGYGFQIEVTYKAIRHGFTVKEMPITFVERLQGASKMTRKIILEAIVRVPKLRFEHSS